MVGHIETRQHIVLSFDNFLVSYFCEPLDHLHCRNLGLSLNHLSRKGPGPRHYDT
jgi:hypothetical protein